MALQLTSQAFSHTEEIPRKYTCDGEDVSPALSWTQLPPGTKSFALIVDDPDAPDPAAPRVTWVHWVLYNLPPSVNGLDEDVRKLPAGTREGLNDWKRKGYGGPCPPVGRHRYYFKLYALDIIFPNLDPLTKVQLEEAMRDHILEEARLIGTYQH